MKRSCSRPSEVERVEIHVGKCCVCVYRKPPGSALLAIGSMFKPVELASYVPRNQRLSFSPIAYVRRERGGKLF